MRRHWMLSVIAIIMTAINAQFNIPLPFGNIAFNKGDDGRLQITSNEGFNFFGFGGRQNVKLTTGNGTFHIERGNTALVNGSEYGGSGAFKLDKEKGIDIGQNLTLGNRTIVGGLGRESSFSIRINRCFQISLRQWSSLNIQGKISNH